MRPSAEGCSSHITVPTHLQEAGGWSVPGEGAFKPWLEEGTDTKGGTPLAPRRPSHGPSPIQGGRGEQPAPPLGAHTPPLEGVGAAGGGTAVSGAGHGGGPAALMEPDGGRAVANAARRCLGNRCSARGPPARHWAARIAPGQCGPTAPRAERRRGGRGARGDARCELRAGSGRLPQPLPSLPVPRRKTAPLLRLSPQFHKNIHKYISISRPESTAAQAPIKHAVPPPRRSCADRTKRRKEGRRAGKGRWELSHPIAIGPTP